VFVFGADYDNRFTTKPKTGIATFATLDSLGKIRSDGGYLLTRRDLVLMGHRHVEDGCPKRSQIHPPVKTEHNIQDDSAVSYSSSHSPELRTRGLPVAHSQFEYLGAALQREMDRSL